MVQGDSVTLKSDDGLQFYGESGLFLQIIARKLQAMRIGGVLSAVEIGHCSRKHELSRTKIAQEMCERAMDIAPYNENVHRQWMLGKGTRQGSIDNGDALFAIEDAVRCK